MIVKTLHGFAVLDLIFGLAMVCFVESSVTGDSREGLLSVYWARYGKSTDAKANGHAPAEGAGKRSYANSLKLSVFLISTRLAINDSIARSETA